MQLIELDTVDSTNNYAARMLKAGYVPAWTVISAKHQTAGKGQPGRKWQDEHGANLLMSVVLYPEFLAPSGQFLLNEIVSLAVIDLANSLKIDGVGIKWPNDIWCRQKKIGGILIESRLGYGKLKYAIAGIGLNVNQRQFPADIAATSLSLLLKEKLDKAFVLRKLINLIQKYYAEAEAGNTPKIHDNYSQQLIGKNQWVRAEISGQLLNVKLSGIESGGEIVVEFENGEIQRKAPGEIRLKLNEPLKGDRQ